MMLASVLLAAPAHAADNAAGKVKAEESCHGDEGAGADTYPSMAGLPVEKAEQAMHECQDGTRTKNRQVIKVATKLSAAGIAELAAYYATFN